MSIPEPPDEMDQLLRRAGANWRAGQPPAPEPDFARIRPPHRLGPARRWAPVLAAAAVVAVAGAIAILPGGSGGVGPVATPTSTAPRSGNTSGTVVDGGPAQAGLVVHDGETVEMSGQVIARPGKAVVMCPSLPTGYPAYPPGQEPAPTCPARFAVTVIDVDFSRLTQPGMRKGVRFGTASVRGVWRNRTIEVREQSAPRPVVSPPDEPPPCAEPMGGWRIGSDKSRQAMLKFVDRNPDRFAEVWLASLKDLPSYVLMVPVAGGDVDATRRELEKLYDGNNLCVVPARFSARQLERAERSLLQAGPAFGLFGVGVQRQQVQVDLLVVTERSYAEFTKIGLHLLDLRPAVRPVR